MSCPCVRIYPFPSAKLILNIIQSSQRMTSHFHVTCKPCQRRVLPLFNMGILPHGTPHLFSMSMYHRTGSYLKQYTIHVKEGHPTCTQYTNCIEEWRPTFILYDCQATEGSYLFIPRLHHSESHLCLFSVNMPQSVLSHSPQCLF